MNAHLTRSLLAALSVLASTVAGSSAYAQTQCPQADRADALEQQGRLAREARRDDEALELFRQAWDLCHDARARARMGLAEAAMGRWLEAEAHVREALAVPQSAWVVENRAQLDSALASIAPRTGDLILGGDGPSARVEINHRPVGLWPAQRQYRVLAGTSVVTLRAEGFVEISRTVVVPPAGVAREEVELVRAPVESLTVQGAASPRVAVAQGVMATQQPPNVPPYPETDSGRRASSASSPLRTWGWIAIAGAAAGGALGVVASVLRAGEFNEYEAEACAGVRAGQPVDDAVYDRCVGLRDDGIARQSRDEAMQIAGFTTAGVLGVTGVILLVIPRGSSRVSSLRCAPAAALVGGTCQWAF